MIKRSFSNDLTVLLSSSYEVDQLQGITQLFWQKELDPQHAERLAELYQNKLDHKVFEMIQKNLMEAINTSKSSLFLTRFFTSLSLDHILHFVKQENPSPFNGYQTGYVRFFYCNPDSCLRQDHILLDERLQNERLYRLVQINTEMSLHHFLLDKEEINALNEQFKELETLSPQRLVLFLLSSVNENELIRDFSINQILAQSDQHGLEFSSIAQAIEGGSGSLVMDKIFEYLKDAD